MEAIPMTTKSKSTDLRSIVRAGIRIGRAIDNVKVYHQERGGLTTYKRKHVASVSAPMVKGAHARTIRIHELLHANHSPTSHSRKFCPIANNAIEDARVHAIYWPRTMPDRANRDCLATAMLDARSLPPMAGMVDAATWNISLLVALRSLAIVDRLGYGKRIDRLNKRLSKSFPRTILDALDDILDLAKSKRGKTKALKAFSDLMRSDEPQDGSDKGNRSSGAASENPMLIVKLATPEACDKTVRKTQLARSGARTNRARLTRAIVSGSTAGLFVRQRFAMGGTYLFDASGSMCLSEERLNELCRTAPAATVAYYSGPGSQRTDGSYGTLVIYSQGGMRAREIEQRYGSNEVDLFAIQWLLRQPMPRVFVSDGGFCGGPEGQDIAAAKLLATAVANGEIIWQQTT